MREIKFRAWDAENKTMWHNSFHIAAPGFAWKWREDEKSESGSIVIDWPVMQFTGLKDKNGKEIYEGDILQYSYSRDTTGKDVITDTYTVEWDQLKEGVGFALPFLNNAEIIGNIYENPELLTHLPPEDK